MPQKPFSWIEPRSQHRALVTLTALLVFSTAGLIYMDRNLVSNAAPLDAAENYALIKQLLDSASATLAPVALWCALAKLALTAVPVAFLLVASFTWVVRRLT